MSGHVSQFSTHQSSFRNWSPEKTLWDRLGGCRTASISQAGGTPPHQGPGGRWPAGPGCQRLTFLWMSDHGQPCGRVATCLFLAGSEGQLVISPCLNASCPTLLEESRVPFPQLSLALANHPWVCAQSSQFYHAFFDRVKQQILIFAYAHLNYISVKCSQKTCRH